MRRAYCLIRPQPHYRRDAFVAGLRAVGFDVWEHLPDKPVHAGDALVIWNRYHENHDTARAFERAGGTVLVAENGYLGVEYAGARWYALSLSFHNGAGASPCTTTRAGVVGLLRETLEEWRGPEAGRDVLLLPQRGIGTPGVAMPHDWTNDTLVRVRAMTKLPLRVREHPGVNTPDVPLVDDLLAARFVVTWGSGAAHHAIRLGVPVFYDMPNWIGACAAARLYAVPFEQAVRPDREPWLGRLARGMWRVEEIASGDAFREIYAATA